MRLKVYDGQEKIRELELSADIVSIGREAGNLLELPDASVSRRHAQVEPNGNFFLIRDSGSTNGTFVNEMLVRVHLLSHGDTVRIGKYLLRVDAAKKMDRESTRVRVEQLSLPSAGRLDGGSQPTTLARFERDTPIADASHARLLRLYEIQAEIGHVDTTQALLERALNIIVTELRAERGSVLLCEKAPRGATDAPCNFVPASVRTTGMNKGSPGDDLVIPEEVLNQVATRLKGVRTAVPSTTGGETRHALMVPVVDGLALRGILYVDRAPPHKPYTHDDVQFATAVAGILAISLANAQLFADTTAAKNKIQAIFTSLADGILVTDCDFNVLEANPAATVFLGVENRNPLGKCFLDLLGDFKLTPEAKVLRASSLHEGAVFHLTRWPKEKEGNGRGKTGDPSEVCFAGKITPFPGGALEPHGLVINLRDRSELRRMEAIKTQFLGNFAHKLRTPLTVIEGNLPLLRDPSHDIEQILEELERNSRSLCQLVNQMTEFADLEIKSARFAALPEATKLRPLVREAIRRIEKEARNKGIEVANRVRDDMPMVLTRPAHVHRAFQLILDNAVKFSGEGGKILVEAEEQSEYVRVDFVDDGPGIPRKEIESVFYICHQVDAEGTGQVPGAGLGLTIARHILQELGGEIRLTSPYRFADHGTQVSVFLPSIPQVGAESAALEAAATNDLTRGRA